MKALFVALKDEWKNLNTLSGELLDALKKFLNMESLDKHELNMIMNYLHDSHPEKRADIESLHEIINKGYHEKMQDIKSGSNTVESLAAQVSSITNFNQKKCLSIIDGLAFVLLENYTPTYLETNNTPTTHKPDNLKKIFFNKKNEKKQKAEKAKKMYNLAFNQYSNKQYRIALENAQKAVKYNNNNADYRYILGMAYVKNNRPKEGIVALECAIELNENKPEFYDSLFEIYYKDKNYKKALECIEKGLRISPNHLELKFRYITAGIYYDMAIMAAINYNNTSAIDKIDKSISICEKLLEEGIRDNQYLGGVNNLLALGYSKKAWYLHKRIKDGNYQVVDPRNIESSIELLEKAMKITTNENNQTGFKKNIKFFEGEKKITINLRDCRTKIYWFLFSFVIIFYSTDWINHKFSSLESHGLSFWAKAKLIFSSMPWVAFIFLTIGIFIMVVFIRNTIMPRWKSRL